MCGLTGFWDLRRATAPEDLERLAWAMAERQVHRGPDDGGVWTDAAAGIAIGQRRLAIIDLSANGHQPMVSADGSLVIAYNGEIYNFKELRVALSEAGVVFRGESDTEVILEGCRHWGVSATATRLIGMFAFALWNRGDRTLTLVRDRMGIKPLYWGRHGDVVFFGSQPKSFTEHPAWRPEVDRNALAAYVRHMCVPSPHSMWRGLAKVRPGEIVTVQADGRVGQALFWDLRETALATIRERAPGAAGTAADDAAATETLDRLLRDAVKRRMVADVPLGAFLSGGVDSSTVVALMQAQSDRPVRTFTIGFQDAAYDEAASARAVARHLGTEHTEVYLKPQDALDLVPDLAEWYDEPFADSSQLPTLLLSRLTRGHVTVALSGDGGDEVFGGYDRYGLAFGPWRGLARVPRPLRAAAAAGLRGVPQRTWDALAMALPKAMRPRLGGHKAHKLGTLLPFRNQGELYRSLVSQWHDPAAVVIGGQEPCSEIWDESLNRDFPDLLDRMQVLDMMTYLPNDILTKVDRASMAVGLEARVPLIDHRVVEFAWRLPRHQKIRRGEKKWLLRQVLHRYVPRQLIDRPKMGFAVPIVDWLRGPLRDWAEALLDERALKTAGLFNADLVRQRWSEHLSGRGDWHGQLWTILMFEGWRRRYGL